MLKWKTKHLSNFAQERDVIKTILITNGILPSNIQGFLKPTAQFLHDPFLLKNVEQAVDLVKKHAEANDGILIRVDSDVDGYCSASILYRFLKEVYPDIQVDYMLDYEKRHGLTMQDMAFKTRDQYGLIIIPDASMTVENARLIEQNFDADIVVLDHHLITEELVTDLYSENSEHDEKIYDCYTNYCVAVNCNDNQYPNPFLSGGGVVQKFIEAYVKKYSISFDTTKYYDLVSLSLIGDSMDLRNLENRYYTISGLKELHYNNEFINEIVARKSDDMKGVRNIINMGWTIAPLINGCIRYGAEHEQEDLFKAMAGFIEERTYQPKRKHKEDPKPPLEYHSLQWDVARSLVTIKNRQDSELKKIMEGLTNRISEQKLDENSIIFVDGTDLITKGTLTGLLANKIASKYFRPTVIMRSQDSKTYGGSMRGYANSPIESFKDFLNEVGVISKGHSNAGGVEFPKNDLPTIIQRCNEKMPLKEMGTIWTVDWEIPGKEIKNDFILDISSHYDIFGSTVPEPVFAITNVVIDAKDIQALGDAATFIKFTSNGITYLKKYCRRGEFESLTLKDRSGFINKKKLSIDIIGTFSMETYDDKTYPCVKILDFESHEMAQTSTNSESNAEEDYDF